MGESLMKADPRVTAYQPAARAYCKLTGEDADKQLPVPHPELAGVVTMMPLWYTVAERMYDLSLLMRCIRDQAESQRAANG